MNPMPPAEEDLVPLAEATAYVRATYKAWGNQRLVWGWCVKGFTLRSGERSFLEHVRVGRRYRTSLAAAERFLDQLRSNADARKWQGRGHENEAGVPG
jgi:hypothetical protein